MSKEQVHDSVREEFKKLSLDGKTAFLVEAIFSTAGSAINEIGTRLNGLVSLVTDPFEAPSGAQEDGQSDESPSTAEESADGKATTSGRKAAGKKAGDSGKGSASKK